MKNQIEITDIFAREILDSRGNPTVEAEVHTKYGYGRASVPEGASKGIYEAAQLRDGDCKKYMGKGVKNAVKNVNEVIAGELIGCDVLNQRYIDRTMCSLDDTPSKQRLGANAVLAVSLAAAKAAASSLNIPLYRYIGGSNAHILPVPMMNILNGGVHADNNIDIQEFMIMPVSASCFSAGVRMCSEVYHTLKSVLKEKNLSAAVGDEGGFAPNLADDEDALSLIEEAVERAGYNLSGDFKLAIDAAASEWYQADGSYKLPKKNIPLSGEKLIEYWENLSAKHNIFSIEDGVSEDDWQSWTEMTRRLGGRVRLVGDDLFVTNTERLKKGISLYAANTVLIKPNQIGTLTQTLDVIDLAHKSGYGTIISHRSGETEDTTIADIAVAVGAGMIKAGSAARSERTSKYNRLLRIEEQLGKDGKYAQL